MSHRDPKRKDFVGKTIVKCDTRTVNIWRFWFDDGTAIAIEVDAVAPGLYGMVVCDECAKPLVPRRDWLSIKEPNGRAKGGHARAAKLSAAQRSAIARKGAAARWGARHATPTPRSER